MQRRWGSSRSATASSRLAKTPDPRAHVVLAQALRSQAIHLGARLERIDALLSSAQQTYFNLAQDEANALMERQGDVTRKMSGYALLIAIPTIAFSLYGTTSSTSRCSARPGATT
jgi:hypothetical protein